MRPLTRKLLRDLWRIRSQALAISLVVAAGVAIYVLLLSAYASLQLTQSAYYERYRFADVFASLRRAPLSLAEEIRAWPDVAAIEARVVADVTLDLAGVSEPLSGRLISLPEDREPAVNDVFLAEGRRPAPTARCWRANGSRAPTGWGRATRSRRSSTDGAGSFRSWASRSRPSTSTRSGRAS